MNETTEVTNSHDLREILELATRKQFLKTASVIGLDKIAKIPVFQSDKDKFDKEAEDFL